MHKAWAMKKGLDIYKTFVFLFAVQQDKARHALYELFKRRSPSGLVSRLVNVQSGNTTGGTSLCFAPRITTSCTRFTSFFKLCKTKKYAGNIKCSRALRVATIFLHTSTCTRNQHMRGDVHGFPYYCIHLGNAYTPMHKKHATECYIGAGIDSYYEYLVKSHVMLGDRAFLEAFEAHYAAITMHMRRGSFFVGVDCVNPMVLAKPHMDSLMAFWPGLQACGWGRAGGLEKKGGGREEEVVEDL